MNRFWFEVSITEDGKLRFNSEGQGFHAFEVLGFLDWKREDLLKQITGEVKPDVVKRTQILPKEQSDE